ARRRFRRVGGVRPGAIARRAAPGATSPGRATIAARRLVITELTRRGDKTMNQLAKIVLGGAAVGFGAWLLSRPRRGTVGYDYRGKVALITGGSRGLGLVMARQLMDRGARVAVCARDREAVDRAGQDLADRGDKALALPCD